MGKFRHRVHGASGVRVPKGMTCESNPMKRRHRAAAAASRNAAIADMVAVDDFEPGRQPNDEKMLEHLPLENMSLGGGESIGDVLPSNCSMVSEGGLSRVSRYTSLTSCTNPTFDAVHRVWKSGSGLQTEVLAVLSAVAELIKERNGTESDVEYFAALITTLDSTPADDAARTAATAYLLHLIVKKVPKEVLQNQFSKTVEIIYRKLIEYAGNDDGAVLKNLLTALGVLLRAQPAVVWNSSNNRGMVVSVAALCTHDKARVRTMSRRVVRTVLTDPVTSLDNGLHAAAGPVGEYINQHIGVSLASKSGALETTRYLCLLEGIMHKMPSPIFKQLAEDILKGLAFADSMVKCAALQCLYRALQRQPCDAALSSDTNALLILSLRSLAPSTSDVAVCAYWMQALTEAHVCLTCKDTERSQKMLGETMLMITKLFQTGNEQLCQIIVQVLSRLVERCIQENEVPARHLLSLLTEALSVQTALVWKHILKTITILFQSSGSVLQCEQLVTILRSLAALRENDQCFCKQEVDFTIGAAVRYVGVQHVLNVLSLQIEPDAPVLPTDFRRSWLLPIFRVNLKNAPLSLFLKYFLPLAMKIYKRLPSLEPVVARVYQVVQFQLWELLPSFLSSSSDFENVFPQLAQVLGAALTERSDLRLIVLTALRSALRFALQPDAPAERTEVMSRYSKNYLPLLFNMYTNNGAEDSGYEDRGVRLSTLAAIGMYVELTPKELLSKYARNAIEKMNTVDEEEVKSVTMNRKKRIMDILIAITKSAEIDDVRIILDVVNPWFDTSSDSSLQKKAFRVLDEVLKRRGETAIEKLFEEDDGIVFNAVLKSYDSISAPARSAHQDAVRRFISKFDDYTQLYKFCMGSLDVTVMCLEKANSMACRQGASKCFQDMCARLIERGTESEHTPSEVLQGVLERVYQLCTAQGEQEVRFEVARACLVALNIVAQKHVKVLTASHIARLISHGCSSLSDSRGPVRVLAIRLVRVLVSKMPEFALHQYRELVLSSFFDQDTNDASVQVRKANRILLEILIEKFGLAVLEKYTRKPEWLKQMRNVEKANRRKARRAAGEQVEEGSEDEDGMSAVGSRVSARTAGADTILQLLEDSEDEDEDQEEMVERRSRAGSVWLREDREGEAVDLLDTKSIINKVTTTDPSLVAKRQARLTAKKKNNGGFALTKDGKLIIDDESDDESKPKRKKKEGEEDELADLLGGVSGGRKGGERVDQGDDEDVDDDKEEMKSRVSAVSRRSGLSTYKPGGTGIHRDTSRPIAKAKRQQQRGDVKKKGQALEPYAYVPLRGKAGGKDLKGLVGKRNRKGQSVGGGKK